MKRQQAITATLAALPALILAACAWLNAQAKAAEAKQAYAGYGEYVTDQLKRDEAIAKALLDCRTKLAYCRLPPGVVAQIAMDGEGEQGQVFLDAVARSRGWEPGGDK